MVLGQSGDYGPLIPGVALPGELLQRAARAPVVRSSKGRIRGLVDLVAEYGEVAEKLITHYAVPTDRTSTEAPIGSGSWWVADRRELHRAVGVPLDTPPEWSPDVAAWLRSLAGPDHELLLDWLATVADLDQGTACLYLRAGPGTGKTLLARGVAALWGDTVVSYAEVSGQFAAGLLESPIVHLSEGASGADTSAAFRSLTGDRFHRVDRKHVDPITLIGHPRLMIGANNDDALPLGEVHHTRDDLDALLSRVLYVRASDDAREVLEATEGVDRWPLPGGAIPRHIAWLRADRGEAVRARGGRWLVAGQDSTWHRALMLRSGGNEGALGAIAEAANPATKNHAVWLVPKRGVALVNVSALHVIAARAPGAQSLTRAALARTIRDLSDAEASEVMRVGSGRDSGQIRVWPISAELVCQVAESHGLTHAAALRAAFEEA
jgi:hypothetical protein